jgi:hypothetical protein
VNGPWLAAKPLERQAKHLRIDIAAGDRDDHVLALDLFAVKKRSGQGDGAARFRHES